MTMAGRSETKLVAPEVLAPNVIEWLRLHPGGFFRPFPARTINNAYFDTFDYASYEASLAGIADRCKVRLRWYGSSRMPHSGQLEVKLKRGLAGWKLTYEMSGQPGEEGVGWQRLVRGWCERLEPAGARWLPEYPQPVLTNRYHRHYFSTADGTVRVTVDVGLEFWDQRYKPYPNTTVRTHVPRNTVVEIKCATEHRQLATELMAGLPIQMSRNSKYCSGLQASHGF